MYKIRLESYKSIDKNDILYLFHNHNKNFRFSKTSPNQPTTIVKWNPISHSNCSSTTVCHIGSLVNLEFYLAIGKIWSCHRIKLFLHMFSADRVRLQSLCCLLRRLRCCLSLTSENWLSITQWCRAHSNLYHPLILKYTGSDHSNVPFM